MNDTQDREKLARNRLSRFSRDDYDLYAIYPDRNFDEIVADLRADTRIILTALSLREGPTAITALDRLTDFMVEETLAMSDEEVLAEAGEDLEEIARAGRAEVASAIAKLADEDALILRMLNALHPPASGIEQFRFLSMMDLSDDQATRARKAVRAIASTLNRKGPTLSRRDVNILIENAYRVGKHDQRAGLPRCTDGLLVSEEAWSSLSRVSIADETLRRIESIRTNHAMMDEDAWAWVRVKELRWLLAALSPAPSTPTVRESPPFDLSDEEEWTSPTPIAGEDE